MNPIKNVKMWCYAAPDGEIQTRSLQVTKAICREAISFREYDNNDKKITYKDYEKKGYTLHRVIVTVNKITTKN